MNSSEFWLKKAREARIKAQKIRDLAARQEMIEVAENYEKLARWAAEREKAERTSD